MTIDEAAHSLYEHLGPGQFSWVAAIGVANGKSPRIILYLKKRVPKASIKFLKDGWEGHRVDIVYSGGFAPLGEV